MKDYPEMNKKQQREADRQARKYSENETSGIPQPLRKYKKSTARQRRREVRV